MLKDESTDARAPRAVSHRADLAIVGGGLAGTCCAITAARAGLKVVLIQDRPVLGGNASSEVRLWVLGATSHMGNNNRWAREGGVIDEILVENLYRNPEGNPLIFDTIVLEKVSEESNITLLLNTAVFEASKHDADTIASVRAFCSQNSTMYEVSAPLFCDASGDGILGFLAGAAFRMGAEGSGEFGEKFAPSEARQELLGHTIYFYSRDAGRPVRFVAPSFALKDITRIPRWRQFNAREYGCQLWWIEHGGLLDTVHESERIKWELWTIVYGVWDHIKNSGEFPEAENLTLEWVGTIPGKRESRRFEGDYILRQQDIVEQRRHADAVSFGGWAIDLHPADGVFSEKPGCNQWHSKGVYQIPYRCLYSRNIGNLFLAGRIISASHVAFGSSRVMATCAHGGQAVGMAAALCAQDNLRPRELAAPQRMADLQRALLRAGQHIPQVEVADADDLSTRAVVRASSTQRLGELPASGRFVSLRESRAMLLPVRAGVVPAMAFFVQAAEPTELRLELRTSSRPGNFTPDVVLARQSVTVGMSSAFRSESMPALAASAARAADQLAVTARGNGSGTRSGGGTGGTGGAGRPGDAIAFSGADLDPAETVEVDFGVSVEADQYVTVCLMANPGVSVAISDCRLTGVLSLAHRSNHRVAEGATQTPPADIGVDAFEFWLPERRPGGENLAMRIDPPVEAFDASNITRGPDRPTTQSNAWVADLEDPAPALELRWTEAQSIGRIELSFDSDFDHPAESVLMGHPETVSPFCVSDYRIIDGAGKELARVSGNHQGRNIIRLREAVQTDRIRIEAAHPSALVPAAVMRVRCYER